MKINSKRVRAFKLCLNVLKLLVRLSVFGVLLQKAGPM